MVEQRSPKPRAEGSSPSAPAKNSATAFAVALFFVIGRNVLATRCGRRPACGACRGASACQWHASYGAGLGSRLGRCWALPTGEQHPSRQARLSPSAPATKPAKTLGFRRFPFFMCCMAMWFILVRILGFLTRLHLLHPSPAPKTHPVSPFLAQTGCVFVFFAVSWLQNFRAGFCASCRIAFTD